MKRRTHRHDAEISLIANAVTGRDGQAKIHPLLGPARHRFHIEWMKWHYLRRRLATLRSGAVIRQEVLARSASTSALAVSAAISAFAWAARSASTSARAVSAEKLDPFNGMSDRCPFDTFGTNYDTRVSQSAPQEHNKRGKNYRKQGFDSPRECQQYQRLTFVGQCWCPVCVPSRSLAMFFWRRPSWAVRGWRIAARGSKQLSGLL